MISVFVARPVFVVVIFLPLLHNITHKLILLGMIFVMFPSPLSGDRRHGGTDNPSESYP